MDQLELFNFDQNPNDNYEAFKLKDGSFPGDLDDAYIFELWMNGELPDLDCGYERRVHQ